MNKPSSVDNQAQDMAYSPFISPGEKTIFAAPGILENTVSGLLILTNKKLFFYFYLWLYWNKNKRIIFYLWLYWNKKLFFYFYSNITRDKKFMATHPFIVSADLKEGLIYSTLTVSSKKESFRIQKLNKKDAREFHRVLTKIIRGNKK